MADPLSEYAGAPQAASWKTFRSGLLYFLLASSLVWLVFYAIYREFPYLQAGSNILTAAKRTYSLTHPLFDADATVRILVFGNSKTLAGFNPTVFDASVAQNGVAQKVQSVNEALPGDRRFVVYLDRLLQAGARPTHVFVQVAPVVDDHETQWQEWIRHDKMIVDTLFPFRTLPRDFTLFVFAAASHGGMRSYYDESAQIANQVMQDRGYYFLKGQSHYPGDRLPDDFSVPSDTPSQTEERPIDMTLPPTRRLAALSKRYGFKVVFFPPVYRTGELAPAPSRDPTSEPLADWPDAVIVGENYWLMPPGNFSDPVHLNPDGALIYTKRLAALLTPVLQDGR